MNFLTTILPTIEHYQLIGYIFIFLVSFVESTVLIGALVPGALIAFFAGALAAGNFFRLDLLIIFATLGAGLGEAFSFYLGRRGVALFKEENKFFKLSYLRRGEDFFKEHGAKSIFWGRFVGPIKIVNPFVAGLAKMKKKKFLVLNFFSLLLWVLAYVLLGYFFGQAWNVIKLWSNRAGVFLLVLFLFLAVFYLLERLVLKKGKDFFLFLKSVLQSIAHAIATNPEVQKFAGRHQKLFDFLKVRLDRKNFSGLPLTLFVLSFVYLLFLFFGVTEDVLTSALIVGVDNRVENLLHAFRSPLFVKLFLWLTVLGKWQIVAVFALSFSAILWLLEKRLYLLPLWLTLGGSELFTFLGKLATHRPRPTESFYLENSFSFPSGHATIITAFAGFLAYFLWRNLPRWRHKLNSLFVALLIIFLVGFSRLYLGVHYLSDVWGGYLLGALWLIIGISVAEGLEFQLKKPPEPARQTSEAQPLARPHDLLGESGAAGGEKLPQPKRKFALALIALVPLIFYPVYAYFYNPPLNLAKVSPESPTVSQDILADFEKYKLSRYSEMLDGTPQEPLGFIISASSDRELIAAFKKAGWYQADPTNFDSVLKIARAALLNADYPTAPMTPSFWQAEVNNFAFEKPTATESVRQRHHARFWSSGFKTPNNKNIYVGVASLDIGIKWGMAHKIAPDIDTEKEAIFADLSRARQIASYSKKKFVKPVLGSNFIGDQFFTDGEIYIIDLR